MNRRRLVRQDPVRRAVEQMRNAEAMAIVRQDPVRRGQETDRRRLVRQDPVRREQEMNQRRLVRQDPVCREQEAHRRRLVRQDPVRRAQEQSANTVRRRDVREQHPIHHEMATKFDRTSRSYLFNQPCGIWNVECRQCCGYIHLSSSMPSTRRKCCANGLLILIRMPC
jgi:hypothetical protein